jgi:predicted acetyltransferase
VVGMDLQVVHQRVPLQEVRRKATAHKVAVPLVERNRVALAERHTWVVAVLRRAAPAVAVFRKVAVVVVVPEVGHSRGVNRQVENHREDSHLDYLDLVEERRLSWSYQTNPSFL